jgi:hypothetical protein
VNLDEYTVTGLDQRAAAVELLEASVLHQWSVGVFRRSANRT